MTQIQVSLKKKILLLKEFITKENDMGGKNVPPPSKIGLKIFNVEHEKTEQKR